MKTFLKICFLGVVLATAAYYGGCDLFRGEPSLEPEEGGMMKYLPPKPVPTPDVSKAVPYTIKAIKVFEGPFQTSITVRVLIDIKPTLTHQVLIQTVQKVAMDFHRQHKAWEYEVYMYLSEELMKANCELAQAVYIPSGKMDGGSSPRRIWQLYVAELLPTPIQVKIGLRYNELRDQGLSRDDAEKKTAGEFKVTIKQVYAAYEACRSCRPYPFEPKRPIGPPNNSAEYKVDLLLREIADVLGIGAATNNIYRQVRAWEQSVQQEYYPPSAKQRAIALVNAYGRAVANLKKLSVPKGLPPDIERLCHVFLTASIEMAQQERKAMQAYVRTGVTTGDYQRHIKEADKATTRRYNAHIKAGQLARKYDESRQNQK